MVDGVRRDQQGKAHGDVFGRFEKGWERKIILKVLARTSGEELNRVPAGAVFLFMTYQGIY